MRTNTPGGNGCTLYLQAVDQKLIQIVGSGNDRIRETGFIQHLTGFFGKVSKITAVETDSVFGKRNTSFFHFLKDADRIRNA